MSNKAIKYRLYPTDEQKTLFAKTFGCCRKVYNLMLADKIESYKTTGKFANAAPAMYKKDYPYLKEVDSLDLASKYLDLQKAFRGCFDKSRKARTGFPKFKSAKHSRKSYTTYNQKGTVALLDGCIKLPKVGKVSAVIHRLPEEDRNFSEKRMDALLKEKTYVPMLWAYQCVRDYLKGVVKIVKNSEIVPTDD